MVFQLEVTVFSGCDSVKGGVTPHPLLEPVRRDEQPVRAFRGFRIKYGHQSRRFFEWKRPEKDSIDDAEHGRVRADAERKCEDGNRSEARILSQRPRSVAGILPKSLQIGKGGHLLKGLS